MPNKSYSIKDDSFSRGILLDYECSVRVAEDTLAAVVLDDSQNMIVAFEAWNLTSDEFNSGFSETFENIKSDSFILGGQNKKVKIIIDNATYTLLPDKLFEFEDAPNFLKLNFYSGANESMGIDIIESISVKNVYEIPLTVEEMCKHSFPDPLFINTCTILINSLLKSKEDKETVFVHFSGKRFDVIVIVKGQLKFCNSFSFTAAPDIIYYILNVYQKLGLDANTAPIILSGEITKDSSAYEIIYRYIRNISFAKRPENVQFCSGMTDLPEQMYYDLFHSFSNF